MANTNLLGTLDPDTLAGLVAAASSTGYEDWWGRVRSSGYCAHPIHLTRTLAGRTTTIYARCENRRETVCPACSDLYALDTWHIVTGGLTPERLTDAAAVFVTLTAPSFGAVHAHHADDPAGSCRPAVTGTCTHGGATGCSMTHPSGDPAVGSPLCADCYDYEAHILTTWWFPALWNRYTRTLRRLVSRRAPGVKVSFVKVMEMQARLAPHYHAILRANNGSDASGIDPETFATFAAAAASMARVEVPATFGTVTLRLGAQVDVQPLTHEEQTRRVGGYLAKYVTKGITSAALPARIPAANIDLLPIPAHHKRVMSTLARLATLIPDAYAGMADRLGTFGWRGHTTTKSRAFSTTMTAQKQHRAAWRAAHTIEPNHGFESDAGDADWEYVCSGHKTPGHRYLAVTAALKHREQLRTAHTANDVAGQRQGEP
ncbi:replication initiator [Microbacterium sp. 22242]|uniref:replication initiator n=1 Tax=Microbacterium sp. 22242 TaxID=3453896 RepID=UPI003F878951